MCRLLGVVAAISVACISWAASAQSDIPNLVGLWECDEATILFREGEWSRVKRSVEVTEQRDAVFQALHTWALDPDEGVMGHTFGESMIGGTIPWVGVIDFDNETIHGGAFGDGHQFQGHLVDRNTIQLALTEAGDNPWASRTTCRRSDRG